MRKTGSTEPYQPKVLHVISKVATPHNNNLMQALIASDCTVKLYYSVKTVSMYSWKDDVFHAIGNPIELGERRIHWGLIWYALTHSQDNYLFIGWPNNTARLLLLLFWILRRPFLFWSDYPDENAKYLPHESAFRSFLYHIVKTRTQKIFLVGQRTVDRFIEKGYSVEKLVNLPVFISLERNRTHFENVRNSIRSKYRVDTNDILFVSGSRLVYAKGFDIFIEAIARVYESENTAFRVVIVGQGEQEFKLRQQISTLNLEDGVTIEPWMDPDEFDALIAASDAYVHVARFDSFGGGTLHAMALGIPVIGSDGAGAVVERVTNGWNGLIFSSGHVNELANCMIRVLEDPGLLDAMGLRARQTAEEWPVERGVQTILDALV